MIESLMSDIKFGLRVLLKNPGFAGVAIITLALGIGANSAIFSVIYGVLLRPLPYANGAQMMVCHQAAPLAHVNNLNFTPQEVKDYREINKTMTGVAEHHSMSFILYGKDEPERLQTGVVDYNFFDLLGVKPILGRTFTPEDQKENADAVILLTYKYWTSHGSDRGVVGRAFQMNNKPHTVIGVLPDFPQYPAEADIYITVNNCPFRSSPQAVSTRNSFRGLALIGRLKPEIQPSQANADISTIGSGFVQQYPDAYRRSAGFAASVVPMQEELTHAAKPTFLILLGTAGLVLLIACANVANLTLARLMRRDREMAVRTALGANRSRLIRQLLTESILMSLVGGGLGLFIASRGLPLLVTFAGRFTNRTSDIKLDLSVLVFTLGISIATGVIFGLLPAFSKRDDLASALKEGGRGSSAGHKWVRNTLVVAQVGVSFVLLIGAGLMLRSLIKIQQVSPGFNPEKVLVMRLTPSFTKFNTALATQGLYDRVLTAMKTQPGVATASLASSYPLNSQGITRGPNAGNFIIEGRPVADGQLAPQTDTQSTSPDFFQAVGIPLVKGRLFTDADNTTALPVMVINQSMARHRWENEDPIGRRISFDNGTTWITIVGIAGDTKWYGLNQEVADQAFIPVAQGFANYLVLKTQSDPMLMSKQIRDALLKTDGDTAVDRINNLEDAMSDSVASPRLMALLLGLFAGVALLITVAGIIGVISLSVTQRTQELGIRMALGASQNKVMGMVMGQGMALVVIGLAIGMFGSIVLTFVVGSMISPLLFSVKTIDPITFVGVSLVLMLVAAFACFVPARRVTGIDPMIALRRE